MYLHQEFIVANRVPALFHLDVDFGSLPIIGQVK